MWPVMSSLDARSRLASFWQLKFLLLSPWLGFLICLQTPVFSVIGPSWHGFWLSVSPKSLYFISYLCFFVFIVQIFLMIERCRYSTYWSRINVSRWKLGSWAFPFFFIPFLFRVSVWTSYHFFTFGKSSRFPISMHTVDNKKWHTIYNKK